MSEVLQKPNFFGENSPFLNHPLLTSLRTIAEVDFIIQHLQLLPGVRVLDVGCGFGRHSLELAQRGYEVVGIDPSPVMIEAANQRASGLFSNSRLSYRCIAGEIFRDERPFDAAVALFTTLGQLSDVGNNEGLIARVYEALTPDGRFLVEVPQRSVAVANLKAYDRFGAGENYTEVSRNYDSHSYIWSEAFRVVNGEMSHNFLLRYRLYSWSELQGLLSEAGFREIRGFGGYDGRPGTDESPIILASAIK